MTSSRTYSQVRFDETHQEAYEKAKRQFAGDETNLFLTVGKINADAQAGHYPSTKPQFVYGYDDVARERILVHATTITGANFEAIMALHKKMDRMNRRLWLIMAFAFMAMLVSCASAIN